jgi:CheY-like chemotaxis protein
MKEVPARRRDIPEDAPTSSNRTQAIFLARLAHELRNPLAPIRMALQIMQMAENDVATSRAARVIIDRQLNQLTHLIEDLSDISQLEDGTLKLSCELTTLRTIVDTALALARPQLESRQNALRIDVPAESVSLFADVPRLSQAVANVLVNASKYSEAGSPITVTASHTADDISIAIDDQGLGIPRTMLTRIFEPFVQVNRHGTGTHDGLGIGLAIVRNVLLAHGGSARVESEGELRGSRFILSMPRGRAVAALPGSAQNPEPSSNRKLRILVADDNRDAAQTLAIMLAYDGHDVRTAYDGLEVLAIGQLFDPDVILLDIGMPVLDGYQTAKQIRERPWGRDVYLVALTGWGQDEDREAARVQGFQHHLVKPASPEKIAAVLELARRSQ